MASHPLRMRKALGSNPSVSMGKRLPGSRGTPRVGAFGPAKLPHSLLQHPLILCAPYSCPHAHDPHGPYISAGLWHYIALMHCPLVEFHFKHPPRGTWCSGITSASHAEGPELKSQCVHSVVAVQPLGSRRRQARIPVSLVNHAAVMCPTPSELIVHGD